MTALVLLLIVIHIHSTLVQGTIIVGPSNVTYLPDLTPLPIELTCNVSSGVPLWRVNGTDYSLGSLDNNRTLPGHNRTGTNILVHSPVNNTEYFCVLPTIDGDIISDPAYIIIADVPAVVPGVTVDISSVSIDMDNVTLTLSWREPFNNFDPIVNYTVSCSTCPLNITTTDNTTRNYTITNLIPMTNYTFSVVATNSIGSGEAGVVMITTPDVPDMVPNVSIDDNTININGNNVMLTLSWGEPFNNLDPIMHYTVTVSCLGDVTCPSSFTTTDNTARFYIITNLTTMTNYTFSVVATNSFGSGEAGVVMIATPAIDQVTGVNLTCEPVDLINQCNVMWNPITQGEMTDTEYQVYYNAMMDVTRITTLTFEPLLPDGVFTGTVVVNVTAVNRYGIGPVSDSEIAVINAASVTDISLSECFCPYNISELYNITVTCNIHPDSTADQCVVRARADSRVTRIGSAPISNLMATVIVNGLECGTNYTIVAGGTRNGDLVGPRSSLRNDTESCLSSAPRGGGDDGGGCEGGCIAGIAVGVAAGVSGGIIGLTVLAYIGYKKKAKVTDQEKGDNKKSKDKDDEGTRPSDEYAVVDKSKKPNQPVTTGGVNYADLDIGKGSNVMFGGDKAVHYAQTTSNS